MIDFGNDLGIYRKFDKIKTSFMDTLRQAWAILRYLVAIIYLDMKKLLPGAEILYSRTIYSLEILILGPKNF
jgi:hypothetical protein